MFCGCTICEKEDDRMGNNGRIDYVQEDRHSYPVCGLPVHSRFSPEGGEGVRSMRSSANPSDREEHWRRSVSDSDDAGEVHDGGPVLAPPMVPDLARTIPSNPDVTLRDDEIVCITGASHHDHRDQPQDGEGKRSKRESAPQAKHRDGRTSKSKKAPSSDAARATTTSSSGAAAPQTSRSSRSSGGAPSSARSSGAASGAASARSGSVSLGSEGSRPSRGKDASPLPPNVHLRPAVSFAVQPVVDDSLGSAPELEPFRSPEGGALKITKVGAALEKWNAEHKYREVHVGDFIVGVDHERGTPEELLARMSQATATPAAAVDVLIKRVVGQSTPSEKPVAKTLLQRLSSYGGGSAKTNHSRDDGKQKKPSRSPAA